MTSLMLNTVHEFFNVGMNVDLRAHTCKSCCGSRRFLYDDLTTAKAENPASHKYVVGNGSKAFSAYFHEIGLSLSRAQNCDYVVYTNFL